MYPFIPKWIATQTELSALVGNRVEPHRSSEGEPRPRITYHRISSVRLRNLHGKTGLRRTRVQFDCHGRTYVEAAKLAKLVQEVDGFSGHLGGVWVKATLPADERDDAQAESGSNDPAPMVSVDIIFLHEE